VHVETIQQRLVGALVDAPAMSLDVDDQMIAVEDALEGVQAGRVRRRAEGLDADHRDQAVCVLVIEMAQVERAFALRNARPHVGDQPADVPATNLRFGEGLRLSTSDHR
jgi:hypothetical protein